MSSAWETSTPTSTPPRKRQPRASVWRSKVSSRRLISWWSGATPPRSRPQGVGRRSRKSISASPCARRRAVAANAPAGPAPRSPRAVACGGSCGGALRGARVGEELGVEVEGVVELRRQLEVREDRVDRARLDAGVAVDADARVDVELLGRLEVGGARLRVDAVDRTDLDAGVVLDAGADDDVGHGPPRVQTLQTGAGYRDFAGTRALRPAARAATRSARCRRRGTSTRRASASARARLARPAPARTDRRRRRPTSS